MLNAVMLGAVMLTEQSPILMMPLNNSHGFKVKQMDYPLASGLCVILTTSGLYYKTITIIIMTIVSDATVWSVTYDHN